MIKTHLDVFTGIGGFKLAAEWNGYETVGFAEINPYEIKQLKQRWPGVVNFGDVRNVPAVGCRLLTAGFPCQPFSCAGKRGGEDDDRFLWPATLGAVEKNRPAWFIGENVAGIIAMELDRCVADLENLGYEVQSFVIPACAVGAKHRRDRVWIVANCDRGQFDRQEIEIQTGRNTVDDGRETLAHSDGRQFEQSITQSNQRTISGSNGKTNGHVSNPNGERQPQRGGKLKEGGQRIVNCGKNVSDSPRLGPQRERAGGQQEPVAHGGQAIPVCNGGDCCEWPVEPELGRVAHGIPNRSHRLKGLGNAIVPQVAYEIIRMIDLVDSIAEA